jgi:branched-chain amino acid transport system substrate-binding protein
LVALSQLSEAETVRFHTESVTGSFRYVMEVISTNKDGFIATVATTGAASGRFRRAPPPNGEDAMNQSSRHYGGATGFGRRSFLGAVVATLAAAKWTAARAATPPIRIGYSMARTGPFAMAARGSLEDNYILWAEQVNAAGGLEVKGTRRKIELIGYDDHSDIETAVRTYEKLMASDKVDLVLAPWGSNFVFAVAPLANKYGYPLLSPTGTSMKLQAMKLPYFFASCWTAPQSMRAVADLLASKKVKSVVIGHMNDLFGLECDQALPPLLKERGIAVLDDKGFPLGVKDLSIVLQSYKAAKPDAFVGMTYPEESFLAVAQSKEIGFNPKAFYIAIAPAFPFFKQRFGVDTEGVIGFGTWTPNQSAEAKQYFDAYVARFKQSPDFDATGFVRSMLQVLQQSIESVGLDRKAIRDYIASHRFKTLIGPISYKDGAIDRVSGTIGQWQNGSYQLVWTPTHATRPFEYPKPVWR